MYSYRTCIKNLTFAPARVRVYTQIFNNNNPATGEWEVINARMAGVGILQKKKLNAISAAKMVDIYRLEK